MKTEIKEAEQNKSQTIWNFSIIYDSWSDEPHYKYWL